MNQMKRILAAALAMALSLALFAGCSKGDGPSASSSTPASSSAASSADSAAEAIQPMDLTGVTDPWLATLGIAGDTVVGKVGEYEITADHLAYWLNYNINYIAQQYAMYGVTDIPWDSKNSDGFTQAEAVVQASLDLAANYRLTPEIAASKGLALAEGALDTVSKDIAGIAAQLGSEELARRYLWLELSDQQVLEELYTSAQLGGMLQEHLMGEGTDGYPTDAEVQAYARDELGIYRVKHILLASKDTATQEPLDEAAVAEKKAQADDLLAQLRAADDPVALFDTLMKEHSEDPGLATYPDGYEAHKGQMVPEFEAASLELKDGEISGVVESDHGYHIILRLPLDPANYRAQLVNARMGEMSKGWLDDHGVTTTEAFDKIDPADFWLKAQSLQMAVIEEVNAALAEQEGAASSSSASSAG